MATRHEIKIGDLWAWTTDAHKRYGVKVKILELPVDGKVCVGDEHGNAPLTVALRFLVDRWETYAPIEAERVEQIRKSYPAINVAQKTRMENLNRFVNACTNARIPMTIHMRMTDLDSASLAILASALEAHTAKEEHRGSEV